MVTAVRPSSSLSKVSEPPDKYRPVGWIGRCLLALVGADREAAAVSPIRERHVHYVTAVAILTTAALATCSATFALSMVFPLRAAAVVAVLWGFVVMNVDRALVVAHGRSELDSGELAVLKRLFPIVLRMPLALLLGFVIAVPLELEFFDTEIRAEVTRQESRVATQDSAEETARLRLNAEHAVSVEEIDHHRGELDRLRARLLLLEDELRDESRKYDVKRVTRTDGEGVTRVVRTKVQTKAHGHLVEQVAQARTALKDAEQRLVLAESAVRDTEAELARKLEALHGEDAEDPSRPPIGLATRFAVLEQLKRRQEPLWFMSWAIRLLFMVIELLPMLLKISGSTPKYDRHAR